MNRMLINLLALSVLLGCGSVNHKQVEEQIMSVKSDFIGGDMINEVRVEDGQVILEFYDSHEQAADVHETFRSMVTPAMFQDLFKSTNLELLRTDAAASIFLAHPDINLVVFNIDGHEPPLHFVTQRNDLSPFFAKYVGLDLKPEDWLENRNTFRTEVLYKEDRRSELLQIMD